MFWPLFLLLPIALANETETSMLMACTETKLDRCRSDGEPRECSKLGPECLICMCPTDCRYGKVYNVTCKVHPEISCDGEKQFKRSFDCRYCFQTNPEFHTCKDNFDCQSTGDPNKLHYRANCSVHEEVLCLGRRQFMKQKRCNWTGGYKWTTALALSVTLGGFGADRWECKAVENGWTFQTFSVSDFQCLYLSQVERSFFLHQLQQLKSKRGWFAADIWDQLMY